MDKYKLAMIFLSCIAFNTNVYSYEPISKFSAEWKDLHDDIHEVSIRVIYDKIDVQSINKTKNKKTWSLNDKVTSCELDATIEVPPGSFEVIDLFGDGNMVVLFAYKIGCSGGVDPVDVKYFAFYKGHKYSLRGREYFFSNTSSAAPLTPTPDYNLRVNKMMLEYMLKKWPSTSIRVLM